MKTKIIATSLLALIINCSAAYSQSLRHKIKDGETIASIARKYGITVEELKKRNPNLDIYFYSGMELVIPEKKKRNSTTTANTNNQDNNSERVVFGTRSNTPTTITTTATTTPTSQMPTNSHEETESVYNEAWRDYMFWYEKKTISATLTQDFSDYAYINAGLAFSWAKGGASSGIMGAGIKKRILLSDLIHLGCHVGPYIGLLSSDKATINDKGYVTNEQKISFTYGLQTSVKAGIKINKDYAITVAYNMGAPEFKFDNFFKGGWTVGITTGF